MSGEPSALPEDLAGLLTEVAHDLADAHAAARALAAAWQRDPAAGERATDELGARIAAALARVQAVLPAPDPEGDDAEDPVWLDGLPASLRRLAREAEAERKGLRVEIALRGYSPPEAGSAGRARDEHLFRIAKAALGGVVRQGRASEATLLLSQERGRMELKLVDDGGFEPGPRPRGRGGPELGEIRDRVEALGGRLRLASRPGGGTILTVTVYDEPKSS